MTSQPPPDPSYLPPVPGGGREMPVIRPDGSLTPRPAGVPAAPTDRRVKPVTTANVFGDIKRAGRWRVPARSNLLHVFGNVVLDLREAEPDSKVVDIEAYGVFGDLKLIVLPGTRVDVSGMSVFGSHKLDPATAGEPGGLQVRVTAYNLFGDVKVKVLAPGEREPKWWRRG